MALTKGYVQIYTGDGKGKTSMALGQAFRAVGRGLKVYMVQFLKAPFTSGEQLAAESFNPLMTIKAMGKGKKGFIRKKGFPPLDNMMAEIALNEARQAMETGEYDLVILDEVNVSVYLEVLSLDSVLDFIAAKPKHVELILTGRNAPRELLDRGDLITELVAVKHYYDRGVKARRGIEF